MARSTPRSSRRLPTLAAACLPLALLAGTTACGSERDRAAASAPRGTDASVSRPATASAPRPATAPSRPVAAGSAPRGTTVSVRPTRFGRILTDGRGYALYLFTRDGRGPSRCYGTCARAWPPLLTRGGPRASGGAQASRLGTVRRASGRVQVTYRGRPLYFYVGDTRPRQVLCQGVSEFGGVWWVVSPRGFAIH